MRKEWKVFLIFSIRALDNNSIPLKNREESRLNFRKGMIGQNVTRRF